MLSKFRLSSHDLEIERGRYDKKSIKPHERYCRYCKSTNYLTVGDEFHFLMECPLYNYERTVSLNKIFEMFPCIEKLNLRSRVRIEVRPAKNDSTRLYKNGDISVVITCS